MCSCRKDAEIAKLRRALEKYASHWCDPTLPDGECECGLYECMAELGIALGSGAGGEL